MDTLEKLNKLKTEHGWSDYKISKLSGLSTNTVSNIFKRNNLPNISTLEAICKAFGITLSQFFAEDDMLEVTPELMDLFNKWSQLSDGQKSAVIHVMESYKLIS